MLGTYANSATRLHEPIECSRDSPLWLPNFAHEWNAQQADDETYRIEAYTIARRDERREYTRCGRNDRLCMTMRYGGDCLLSGEIRAEEGGADMAGLSLDFARRNLRTRLIRAIEPDITRTEERRLNEALVTGLPARGENRRGSTSAETARTRYRASVAGRNYVLEATPTRNE